MHPSTYPNPAPPCYSTGMKAIMKELRWMELPKGCKRTSTSIELPVPVGTLLDETPRKTLRMLAVSGEDFTFSFSAQIVQEGARCGLVVYQDSNDWFWASANKTAEGDVVLSSCTAIHGHADLVEFPIATTGNKTLNDGTSGDSPNDITWKLLRAGNTLTAQYSTDGKDWRFVRSFSLPSTKGAVSFGLLAGNGSGKKIVMEFRAIVYRPEEKPCSEPPAADDAPKTSNATTALL